MKHHGTAFRLTIAAFAVLLAVVVANADDTKKPAAVSASKPAASSGTTAKAKPAAVKASTAEPIENTYMEVVDATVPVKTRQDDYGIYDAAHSLQDVFVTVRYFDDVIELEGISAFQILVEKGYFIHRNGVGFIPTETGKKMLGIRDDSTSGGGGAAGSKKKSGSSSFMGTTGGPDIKQPTKKETDLVDPGKPEIVAEDPSQKGGLFGYGFDGPLENYNPDDPNTPEGKRKVLRDRNSVLSRECNNTPESKEYWSCSENCSNLLFAEYGKVTHDKVDECRRNCKAVFEQNKPRVCHESDAVTAELDQLGDE